MKDMLDNPLHLGDLVAYPTRRGSCLELHLGTVLKVGEDAITVRRADAGLPGILWYPSRVVRIRKYLERCLDEDLSGRHPTDPKYRAHTILREVVKP